MNDAMDKSAELTLERGGIEDTTKADLAAAAAISSAIQTTLQSGLKFVPGSEPANVLVDDCFDEAGKIWSEAMQKGLEGMDSMEYFNEKFTKRMREKWQEKYGL